VSGEAETNLKKATPNAIIRTLVFQTLRAPAEPESMVNGITVLSGLGYEGILKEPF
jgi:hypothetical protein